MGTLPMQADVLPPSDDRVFKLLLTSPKAKEALMNLISAIIGRRVVDVTIHANELPAEDTHEKGERFDVNCTIDDGTQVNIEMQAWPMEEDAGGLFLNLKWRGVYYLTDMHASQYGKGVERYDRMAQSYQITFCTYTIFQGLSSYVNSFSLRHDETGEQLCDAIHIVFVELSKLGELLEKPVEQMTDLDKWAVFFQYAADPQKRRKVNEVIESTEVLQVAGELLMNISTNEDERARYRSRKKYEMDRRSDLATAWDSGKAEGRAEGLEEGAFNNMLGAIHNIMDGLNISPDKAMTLLKVPESERSRYKEKLQPQ